MRFGDSARRRWALIGLFAYLLCAGLVLLLPVSYSEIVRAIGDWLAQHLGLDWFGSGWVEFTANILLFAPLGALLVLWIGRFGWSVLAAVAISVGAELAQIVIPGREPTIRDVISNTIGALLGAGVGWLLTRKRSSLSRRRSSQLLDQTLPPAHRVVDAGPAGEDRRH